MSLLNPQLEAFLAIVKAKTVHGAAHEIHLTQTAVTQRIRALERSLHTTLFIRTRRGMLLTTEGEALLRYCHSVKQLEGETLAAIQGAGTQTEIELSITAATSIMQSRIMPGCLLVMKKFPELLIRFHMNDTENRHLALRAGQMDLAIIQEEHLAQEMKFKKLLPEKYVLVCSTKWKNRKLNDIIRSERIIDFDPTDQMTFHYLKQYGLLDLARHSRHYINSTDSLAWLVAAGVGYTTLAKEFAMPFVQRKQLIILNKAQTYDTSPVLVWYARPEPPRWFSAVVNAIK